MLFHNVIIIVLFVFYQFSLAVISFYNSTYPLDQKPEIVDSCNIDKLFAAVTMAAEAELDYLLTSWILPSTAVPWLKVCLPRFKKLSGSPVMIDFRLPVECNLFYCDSLKYHDEETLAMRTQLLHNVGWENLNHYLLIGSSGSECIH